MAKRGYYNYSKEKKKDTLKKRFKIGEQGWDILKTTTGLVASGCATVVLHNYLKGLIPADASTAEKVIAKIGVYFVSGMVGNKVEKYVHQEFDEVKMAIQLADEAIKRTQEAQEGQEDA